MPDDNPPHPRLLAFIICESVDQAGKGMTLRNMCDGITLPAGQPKRLWAVLKITDAVGTYDMAFDMVDAGTTVSVSHDRVVSDGPFHVHTAARRFNIMAFEDRTIELRISANSILLSRIAFPVKIQSSRSRPGRAAPG